jgi:hypothetical protein
VSSAFSYRIVVSKQRAPKIRSPIRCKCSSNIIVNTKPLLSYNLLLDPSLPINQSIYLSISIRTQAGRAQNGDSSCACIKFLYLRRRNKFRCNMAIVICPTEGT